MKDKTFKIAYDLIKVLEGEKLSAYLDSEGIVTIGVGITAHFFPGLKLGTTITQEQSQALFLKTLAVFAVPLTRLRGWDDMTAGQQASLISFAFNTGYYPGHPEFQTLNRALVESPTSPKIPKAFMLYVNPGSPSELGLKRRRRAEGLVWYGRTPENARSTAWQEIQ